MASEPNGAIRKGLVVGQAFLPVTGGGTPPRVPMTLARVRADGHIRP